MNERINNYCVFLMKLLCSEQLCKRLGIFLAGILSVSSLCSGCSREKAEKTPELMEPVAINSSYRPVERGSIGDIEILLGTVVPKQYCSFFLTSVICSEITVQVGDYVKKGDIVAYADIDSSRESLKSLQEELEHENRLFEIENDILEESKNQLGSANSQIAVYDENIRYNRLMHQYRTEKLQEEIESLQQVVDDGVLRAVHDGYVTYVKNISYEPNAQPLENIVIISDTNDIYIELADKKINEYKYSDYENKYINISGEKINVKEMTYSSEEMIQAKINGRYPNVRFALPEGSSIKIGDTCPIYFVKNKVEDVPIIAKDSLYEENDEYYVYVYKGENQREKRTIAIGASDKNYVQVASGLAEGELVYYESDKRIPSDYSNYEISLSDFEIENYSKTYELSNELLFKYICKREGKITKLAVADGDSVEKGDLLYIIDIGEGKAALAEAQNNINRENKTYRTTIKELKKELKKLTDKKDDYSESQAKIIKLKIDKANETHNYSLKQLQDIYDKIGKDNDGTGKVSVYSEDSGVVRNIKFSVGESASEGEEILSVGVATKDKLLVGMREISGVSVYEENIADIGESVYIKDGDATYEGKCIGWTVNSANNEDKSYVYSDNDNTYISFSTSSGYQYPAFYVELINKSETDSDENSNRNINENSRYSDLDDISDENPVDNSFYDNMPMGRMVTFSYIFMQDVITVPKKYIHTEISEQDEECSYVWRIVGDTVVKQYVLTNQNLSNEVYVVILSGVKEGDILAAER